MVCAADAPVKGWTLDNIPNPKRDPIACGLHPDTSKQTLTIISMLIY